IRDKLVTGVQTCALPISNAGSAIMADPAFVPTFRSATVTDGVNVWPLNSNYFASKETAQWIANKYGIGQVIETPFGGSGGPFARSEERRVGKEWRSGGSR